MLDKYWIYHSNRVDSKSALALPEDRLWLVIRNYHPRSSQKGFKI